MNPFDNIRQQFPGDLAESQRCLDLVACIDQAFEHQGDDGVTSLLASQVDALENEFTQQLTELRKKL